MRMLFCFDAGVIWSLVFLSCSCYCVCVGFLFVFFTRLLGKETGMTSDAPYLDPCLPLDAQDEIHQNGQTMYLRGTGDFNLCREIIQPFMNKTNETQTSLNGVYQPAVHFQNSEFYGFSEFYYCTEDVLRMGGDYNAAKFTKAAKVKYFSEKL